MDSSYVVSYCSPTRYCPFPFPLFSVPAPRAYCTGAYCHVHVYRTVPLLPGDLSFDLLSPGKPSCISLCTYFAQYIHLSPVLSVELCSSLYCSQSAGAPACPTLGSSSSLDSSRNSRADALSRCPYHQHGDDEDNLAQVMLKPERFRILANQRGHLAVVADKALLKRIRECSDREPEVVEALA